jgi:flagellar hook assembly protein FlgD
VGPAVERVSVEAPRAATIRFSLPRDERVTLRLYAQSGELVRSLLESAWTARGRHDVRWDLRDRRNRSVSDGVYLYELRTAARTVRGSFRLVR